MASKAFKPLMLALVAGGSVQTLALAADNVALRSVSRPRARHRN